MSIQYELPPIDEEKTINKIVKFIKQKLNEASAEGIILGLSGGLDSSTVAYLASLAIKPEKVLGLILPSETTPSQEVDHAQMIAEILGIEYEIIPISPLIESFDNLCIHQFTKMAEANLMARMRMLILYYHANSMNLLVAGTGNLSELLIGYFTKYGDGGVDFLPIGDIYKTHVQQLAYALKIPEEIITKPPSAGLWIGQSDEEEIGMDYPTLDQLLYLMMEKEFSDEKLADKMDLDLEEIKRIRKMVKNSQHKLHAPESPVLR